MHETKPSTKPVPAELRHLNEQADAHLAGVAIDKARESRQATEIFLFAKNLPMTEKSVTATKQRFEVFAAKKDKQTHEGAK